MSPKKQPRRVAAWIYAVVNPIIECLQRELWLLDAGNLTWRPQTGRCEIIRTVREYVDPAQWPNLDDFLAEHKRSGFPAVFKKHDSSVDTVNSDARGIFKNLISSEKFEASIRADITAYEQERTSVRPQAPPLGNGHNNDVPSFVAEYLINNTQTLPSHYLLSAFWNSVGPKYLASFRTLPEFRGISRDVIELAEVSGKLKTALESLRLHLSRNYDIPAAPVPAIPLES